LEFGNVNFFSEDVRSTVQVNKTLFWRLCFCARFKLILIPHDDGLKARLVTNNLFS
jgi:hypothetical protein